MSLDTSLLQIAARLPLTGTAGDDVKFYSQSRMAQGLFTKTGCDFTSSQSKFGTSSLEFSGQSSKLSAKTGMVIGEAINSPSLHNFTISCFARASRVDLTYQGVFSESTSHAVFFKNNTIIYYGNSSSLITSSPIVANQWYHIALCKSGSTITLYVDGVVVGAGITRNVMMPIYYIGGTSASNEGLTGFINDFKYENAAIYSGNFTPPSSPMTIDLYDQNITKSDPIDKLLAYISNIKSSTKVGPVRLQKVHHLGPGKILGTVKEAHLPSDVPLSRRVRLYRKTDGLLIDETWSNATGNYAFTDIAIQKYFVVAFDHTDTYNAVIKDSITPVI